MLSLSTGECHDRSWQAAVLDFKISQGIVTTVPRINIERHQTRFRPGTDADIRVWPFLPPGFDDALIGGRVIVAVPGARVLPDGARWLLAGAPACFIRCMQGKDRPAPRGCKPGIVNRMVKLYKRHASPERCCVEFAAPWYYALPGAFCGRFLRNEVDGRWQDSPPWAIRRVSMHPSHPRRAMMCSHSRVVEWTAMIRTHLPTLSQPQATVVAWGWLAPVL